jgi:hypothetical protein
MNHEIHITFVSTPDGFLTRHQSRTTESEIPRAKNHNPQPKPKGNNQTPSTMN